MPCSHLLAAVSTHSRAEAAACVCYALKPQLTVSTHSRAEAAASPCLKSRPIKNVSTHSRAEAAAYYANDICQIRTGFNTQPRGGGCMRVTNGN